MLLHSAFVARYTERRFGRDGCGLWTGVTRERLPAIVPDGDNSSPDAPLGIGGTESK